MRSYRYKEILINKYKKKKSQQLGMDPSTASGRLVKDLLFKFAMDLGHKCHQCGEDLDRETFSIEHKIPWLDSDNPIEVFFDLNNVAFSHLKCNSEAARKSLKPCGSDASYKRGCRCNECKKAHAEYAKRYYKPKKIG